MLVPNEADTVQLFIVRAFSENVRYACILSLVVRNDPDVLLPVQGYFEYQRAIPSPAIHRNDW